MFAVWEERGAMLEEENVRRLCERWKIIFRWPEHFRAARPQGHTLHVVTKSTMIKHIEGFTWI
jgi:hypothetical protein